MKTAVLRGQEQTLLGGLSAIAEGDAAIVVSRGGAQKPYPSVDPNEDVAAFARGEGGTLLAVADGHHGREAAEWAVERILEGCAPRWTARDADGLDRDWEEVAADALVDANAAILQHAARGGRAEARTTLALALLRPREDLLAWASVADSSVFRVTASEARALTPLGYLATVFLGDPADTEASLRPCFAKGRESLAGTRAVVLATDGFAERGIGVDAPEATLLAAAERAGRADSAQRALELARGLVEDALSAHRRHRAGDNVATACAWLSRDP
jgi:hypothetical protein